MQVCKKQGIAKYLLRDPGSFAEKSAPTMAGQTGVIPKSAEPKLPATNGNTSPLKGTAKPGGIWPIASGRETPADLEEVIPVNQGRLAKYEVWISAVQ